MSVFIRIPPKNNGSNEVWVNKDHIQAVSVRNNPGCDWERIVKITAADDPIEFIMRDHDCWVFLRQIGVGE